MTRFWLATFALTGSIAEPPVGPIVAARTRRLAIEVLRDDNGLAVLFSSADDLDDPANLTCLIGFANVTKSCNLWLDRGFPLVDAEITQTGGGLTIVAPLFTPDRPIMRYDTALVALSGVDVDPPSSDSSWAESPGPLAAVYRQRLQTPDGAQPDVLVTTKAVTWAPERLRIRRLSDVSLLDLDFGASAARCPSLAPLATGPLTPHAAWSGELHLPRQARSLGAGLSRQQPPRAFGVPAFRFENVEILGFRIDLAGVGGEALQRGLARLIKPLNFHLAAPSRGKGAAPRRTAVPDFRYRVASPTIVIELLRYGRMKARVPSPPLTVDDTQSQHELLVRVLVGRVEDDTAQAHSPATFTPAVFVDNPWSKVLGRDWIGFDKRLADFYVQRDGEPKRLLPDGRLADRAAYPDDVDPPPEPLGDISEIRLVEQTSGRKGQTLLELQFASADHTSPGALQPIDLDLIFGSPILAAMRWRQSDFSQREFRRSFASLAVAASVRSFRLIQVAPVADRGGLRRAWITGTFNIDDSVRAALPTGTATLKLHPIEKRTVPPAASAAPSAWNLLCGLVGDCGPVGDRGITLPPGSWYRLLCSMDLTIDDGLS